MNKTKERAKNAPVTPKKTAWQTALDNIGKLVFYVSLNDNKEHTVGFQSDPLPRVGEYGEEFTAEVIEEDGSMHGTLKILTMSKLLVKAIKEELEAWNIDPSTLIGVCVKIKRTGKKFTTQYQVDFVCPNAG